MSALSSKMLSAMRAKYKKVIAQDDYRGFISPNVVRRKRGGAAPKKVRIPRNPYGSGVSAGRKRKTKAKRATGTSTNPWIKHVKAYQNAHPSLSYKEAMQKARASY
jgi:hypothetical protein